MPAVNCVANPPPCLVKYVKFSMKALIPHKTDLKTAFQTFFLFSAFAKCEIKLEVFFLFCVKVKFLDLPNLDKTIPKAFLAHLSRRLTRWAYSIAMVRRPSVVVRRRPHFQTCISLKPAGHPRSNFMCSITGVGERLHKVLGQIRSKLWFPWQQKAPIELQWEKRCLHLFSVVFDRIIFILAGNKDMHKISDEFEFPPDRTTDYGCPWASKKFPIDL